MGDTVALIEVLLLVWYSQHCLEDSMVLGIELGFQHAKHVLQHFGSPP